MATDWAADVKKYAANADDAIIKGLVRYCGIALTKVDSSLVAFSDPKELDRVRNNFLKKKLGRTEADSVLNAAIAKVGETMKADRTKNRVTVYYLLADHFGQLGLFMPKGKAAPAKKVAAKPAAKTAVKAAGAAAVVAGAAAAAKKPAVKKVAAKKAAPAKKAATAAKLVVPAKPTTAPVKAAVATAAVGGAAALASAIPAAAKDTAETVVDTAKAAGGTAINAGVAAAGAVGAAAVGAAALAGGTATKATSAVTGGAQALTGNTDDDSGLGWLWWLLGLAALLFLAWWLFLRGPSGDADGTTATTEASPVVSEDAAVAIASAPAEGSAAIPEGAGVTTEIRDSKPVVKVYFATGKTDVAPAFTGSATGLKQWLTDHPGSTLAISGYADPTGNARRNEQLAKKRAGAVQAQLIAAGVPADQALLVKPAVSTDSSVPKEAARRVEVVVK